MKSEFRQNFEAFCRIFNGERSYIIPLINVNSKTAEELREEGKIFISHAARLNRINYITQSQRAFSIEELSLCFRDIKSLSIGQSLKLFERPNHKDRYSNMLQYLSERPTIFAQIAYFYLVQNDRYNSNYFKIEDDHKFFCFSTFPSIFMFFTTKLAQDLALKFIESLFQLHFYLHSPSFSKQHNFLKDFLFSFFISTNPCQFFESSILPIIATSCSFIEDRKFMYTKTLCRSPYWIQVIHFVDKMIERMETSVSLLPEVSRLLISTLLKICEPYPNLKYELIIDSLFCQYILNYVESPEDLLLNDSVSVLRCLCGLPNLLDDEISELVFKSNIKIGPFIEKLELKREIDNSLTTAMSMSDCTSLITSRDLTLIYSAVFLFSKYCDKNTDEGLTQLLTGISIPKNVNDHDFIQIKSIKSTSSLNQVKMLSTAPYDEIIDIFNSIDLSQINYSTPEELQKQIFMLCSIYLKSQTKQKITTDILTSTNQILANVTQNHQMLKSLSNDLSSALFVITNEKEKYQRQYSFQINILIRKFIIPTLIDHYPNDFLYDHKDIFSPCDSYNRLIDTVTKRINSLRITPENELRLKKSFFLDFIDQIDVAFSFQSKIKTEQTSLRLSEFLIMNSQCVTCLSPQKQKIISAAAVQFQFIKNVHKISFNLLMALKAASIISMLPDNAITIAIAMSGNVDIFGFMYFTNSYFKDERIANVLMTKKEQELLNKIRKSCQYLRDGSFQKITL
ncbi:hypothetical protein TRFO_20463 [Tritrichomonas foetus]|uniref:Uncharacterized protein n=1 Tax=Tritrichomonas foetus TaxID=1144522 RepID=A0A1J4KKV2_9EUKA|nr:hypothetical protein TRFO_20463 [Tritrichomonas foetus]|eukprot:OHT10326.1 hypothetical protein TRFO_20463 [Tritrichomonas foetus]